MTEHTLKLVTEYQAEGFTADQAIQMVLADAIHSVAFQIQWLGNGESLSQIGAMDNLARSITDGFSTLAEAMGDK